jgi:polyribonucleotide nucleotidyltransferase
MLKAEEAFVTLADGRQMRLETGRLAKQAAGAAVIQVGDTVILATVCFGPDKDADFFPLTVEYKEKAYSTGRFPGGYIKREGRPSEDEILTARIIDRPIRPMFPENFTREVQVVVQVLSTDRNFVPGVFGVSAASLAIGLSELPFEEQVAAVRVAVIDGKPVVNPSYAQAETSDVEMIVSGTMNSVVMVEGGAFEVDEQTLVDAVLAGHEVIKTMCKAQQELVDRCAKAKMVLVPKNSAEDIAKATELVKTVVLADLDKLLHADMVKSTLYPAVAKLQEKLLADDRVKAYIGDSDAKKAEIKMVYGDLERTEMRNMILNEGRRIDGRKTTDIRHIEIQTQVLPSVHGSTVFQRGETQALVTCTLGTKADEQRIETLQGDASKNYMLHYNFPPFSVGEVKRMGTVGRREIGHGHLAERSLSPVLPHPEDFPYTIRIVSEILESNGSSSMASVCGGSLALMDAGVPIKSPVAGIAMGLISGNGKVEILSDITGTEDHLGDMDFKVTGTKDGITAFQMDIKIKGITAELMGKAMSQARAGRLHILGKMAELGLANPRPKLSEKAPVMIQMRVPTAKIREVIGPGGAVIKGIQAQTGATVNISDDGRVDIAAPNGKVGEIARKMIEEIVSEAEVGRIYKGKVKSIVAFGAFVEILPGKDGLVHVSELADHRVDRVEDVLQLGDEISVKCIGVDPKGKVKLSIKALKEA